MNTASAQGSHEAILSFRTTHQIGQGIAVDFSKKQQCPMQITEMQLQYCEFHSSLPLNYCMAFSKLLYISPLLQAHTFLYTHFRGGMEDWIKDMKYNGNFPPGIRFYFWIAFFLQRKLSKCSLHTMQAAVKCSNTDIPRLCLEVLDLILLDTI